MDSEVRDAPREGPPILIGRDNRLVKDLEKIGRTRFDDLKPGEGIVQMVPNAFGNVTATVVAGADPPGTEAASQYLAAASRTSGTTRAARCPLPTSAPRWRAFSAARASAGQASQALREVGRRSSTRSRDKTIESFEAKLFLESADTGVRQVPRASASRAAIGGRKITVASQAITAPAPVIDETIDVPWEVDEFRARLRAEVLPKVTPGAAVDLEVRLSESPEFRKTLADEVAAELSKAGAKPHPRARALGLQAGLSLAHRAASSRS